MAIFLRYMSMRIRRIPPVDMPDYVCTINIGWGFLGYLIGKPWRELYRKSGKTDGEDCGKNFRNRCSGITVWFYFRKIPGVFAGCIRFLKEHKGGFMEVKSMVQTIVWVALEGLSFLWILSLLISEISGKTMSELLSLLTAGICG